MFQSGEIFYCSSSDSGTGYALNSTRVDLNTGYFGNMESNIGRTAFLNTGYVGTGSYNQKIKVVKINETSINTKPFGAWEYRAGSESATDYIYIYKVIGYR